MAYTYTFTGVEDEITALKFDKYNIEVTFKVHGTYNVFIADQPLFGQLKKMNIGQKVLVAKSNDGIHILNVDM